ncbi:hypothetical protein M404DRAFT_1007971, partial [Pisolithus tinctorius Marx 270]
SYSHRNRTAYQFPLTGREVMLTTATVNQKRHACCQPEDDRMATSRVGNSVLLDFSLDLYLFRGGFVVCTTLRCLVPSTYPIGSTRS